MNSQLKAKMKKDRNAKRNVAAAPVVMDLEQSIPAILTVLGRQLSGSAGAKFNKKFGINQVDWRILSALSKEQNLSAKQICTITVFDKALISRRLDKLNRAGYVKTRQDKNNKNLTQSTLTAKGKKLYSNLVVEAQAREKKLLSKLSKVEQKSLLNMLRKLQTNIP